MHYIWLTFIDEARVARPRARVCRLHERAERADSLEARCVGCADGTRLVTGARESADPAPTHTQTATQLARHDFGPTCGRALSDPGRISASRAATLDVR